MKTLIVIRVFKDKKLVDVKQFTDTQIVVGHNADVQIDLDAPEVSAIHCLLELRESGFFLCDLGSSSGTFKNGIRVLDDEIKSGEEFQVGPFTLSFFVGVPKVKATEVSTNSNPKTSIPNPGVEQSPSDKRTSEVPRTSTNEAPRAAQQVHTEHKDNTEAVKESVPPIQSGVKDLKLPLEEVTKNKDPRRPDLGRSGGSTGNYQIAVNPFKKKQKGQKTFAPPSPYSDLGKHLQLTKGGVLEVIVSWKERIINSQHLRGKKTYTIGTHSHCDISIPAEVFGKVWPLIQIQSGVQVRIPMSSHTELITSSGTKRLDEIESKIRREGSSVYVRLDQHEIISIKFPDSDLQVYVRLTPPVPLVPLIPPFLFSTSELTGLVMSGVLVALLWLWVTATKPIPSVDEEKQEERIAKVVFDLPKLKIPPPPPPPIEEPPPPPPIENKEKIKVVESDKTQEAKQKGKPSEVQKQKVIPKKAAEVMPIPNSKNRPKIFTSSKQGGSFKQANSEGANAESAKPKDVTKMGLFSAFGGGGHRSQLDQAYSGAGDVLGSADKASGNAGSSVDRAGDDLGSKFKDVGAGGKGTQTQGISGIGTKGRSSGQSAYGSINGFGNKSGVSIEAGGAEQEFIGTIDKEAVRRVIRARLNEIRGCYERELNKLPKGVRLEGKVVVSWTIVEKGAAMNVAIKDSSLNNSSVESCIRSRIGSWTYPEPPKGSSADVSYPFVFKPGE